MQSVCGLDLVSGALKSTLARAQQNYDFNSPNNKNHLKNPKKNASLKEGQCGNWDSGKDSVFNHWNIAVKSNNLQFSPSGYQLSSFIETIRSKYECLNPSKVEYSGPNVLKRPNNILKSKLVSNKLKGKSKTGSDKCGISHRTIATENGKAKKSILKEVTYDNTKEEDSKPKQRINLNELYQQVKDEKKESRKRKKELRKLARLKKLQLTQPHLFRPDEVVNGESKKNSKKTIPSKENNNQTFKLINKLNNKKRGMKETMENSVVNGGETATPSQLSQPRVVLYPRSKVAPGWKTRVPVGCGLINLGNSCYMNASLQALFHTPAFVNWLMDDNEHRQNCRNLGQSFQSCLICAMNNTLRESLNRQIQCMRPLQIHNKLKVICKHFTHGRQEDAHEFLRYLLESMERSYLAAINSLRLDNRSKETTPLGQIFGGYLRTEVACLKCNFISTTFQPLAELQLDIRHVTTLEDAIQNHFKKERLDNNDYKCEKCHTISPATKQFSLEIPPIVLCLQLKRFTLFGNKINKPIHCNRSLNLTRYLHKSVDQVEIKYRLVALVTHIGSSPNCGHYTAIAEASNGNFYQFDDSYVRQVSVQTALNTDAYVIIYEMDRNQNHLNVTTNGSNGLGVKSSTVTSSLSSTSPVTVNGNTSNGGRLGSPVPVSKRFNVPFLKSPVTNDNSALKAATLGSPTTTNSFVNGGSNHSLSNSSKLLNGHHPGKPGGNSQNRDKILDARQIPTQSVSYSSTPKINILKPGVGLTNSRLFPDSTSRSNNTTENSSSFASSNGLERRLKSPSLHLNSGSKSNSLTNGVSHTTIRESIQLVPYENDERTEPGFSAKIRNKDKTPEKLTNEQLYPETPPKSPTVSPLSFDKSKLTKTLLISKSETKSAEQLIPKLQVEQQSGVKRKLEESLSGTGSENKLPRLLTSTSSGESIKLNGSAHHPVSSTSNWEVIANSKIGHPSKSAEIIQKSASRTGHSSDPESILNSSSNSRYVDFHRAKSVERCFHSQNNRNDAILKVPTEKVFNNVTSKTPEKQRKSPGLEPVCSTSPFSKSYEPLLERLVDSPATVTGNINGHTKTKEQKRDKRDNFQISSKIRSRSSSSSMSSSSDSSSDEKHKKKNTKHKKKQKKIKHKRKKSKKHKKSSSSSSSSGSGSESEELLETKHKSGPMKLVDKIIGLKKKNRSSKKHKRKKEDQSPETASTELSEDGKHSLLKSGLSESTELTDVIRSLSEERERDRRKNRNPSRSPDRENCPKERKEEKFNVHKITSRDQQIMGWNGAESALSKSIDSERKHLVRKNKDELFDEEVDFGRVKKAKKSMPHENENGSSGNKFQNYEDKKKEVHQWSKLLNGYGDNFRGENKYHDKSNDKSSSGSSDHQERKGFPYRSGHSSGSGYSRSYGSHNSSRTNGQLRNGKGGRGGFSRYSHNERNHHHSSYHRDNRERRPS